MKMPSLPTLPQPGKNSNSQAGLKVAKPAPQKKEVKIEPAEDSIGLRLISCCISVLCIVTACIYVNSSSMLIFFYLWGALTGSYVSYQFRHQKTFWLTFITTAGLLIVLGNFFEEMVGQFNSGKIQALVPFIHVLTGLQALHTFDLRAKSDVNVSALIGLGLFACTAVIARDALFAYITLGYITLIAGLLYFEAVARTRSAGAAGISSERTEINELREAAVKKKVSVGNAFLSLAMLPVLSIVIFLALPRVDSLFDLILNNIRRAQNGESLNLTWVRSSNGLGILGGVPGLSGAPTGGGAADGQHGGKSGGNGRAGGRSGPGGTDLVPGAGAAGGPGGSAIPGAGTGGTGSGENVNGGAPGDGKSADGKSGKSGKGGKDKNGKSNNPGDVSNTDAQKKSADSKGEQEKTPEEEDKSMVFRNKDSVEHENDLIMRVMSSRDTYFRRVCFDKYDGHSWTISDLGKISKCSKHKNAYQELGGVPSLFVEPGMHSAQLTQEITVESDIGHLLPVASIPQQISYPKDPILVDQFGALRTKDPIKAGTHYRVVSQVPDYDLDEMRKASFDTKNEESLRKEFESYLQLPADLSPDLIKLAKSVAGNDGNWFARAERICNFLRRNYKYSSDLTDSDDKEEIAYHFLFRTKEGACGPFTTAFVVMCRAAGLPARSIGGFGPGDFNEGTGMHEIKNLHGHAWGEVYIPGYDWVPFDATPTGLLPKPTPEDNSFMGTIKKGIDQLSDRFANQTPTPPPLPTTDKGPQAAGQSGHGGTTSGGTATGTGTGTNSTTTAGKDGKSTKSGGNGSSTTDKNGAKPPKEETKPEPPKVPEKPIDWHQMILLIVVVPAVILLIQAIRAAINQARAARKAKTLEKPKPSTLLYLKVVDDLARVKIYRLPTDTPQDLLARFTSDEDFDPEVNRHPDLEPLCKHFMELYIADRFGCDDAAEMRANQMKQLSDQIHTLVRTKHHDN
ncbi:MAG: transglutaminaseTgpA domain-containing protein [Candidatus Obscuribacterales bacterium]